MTDVDIARQVLATEAAALSNLSSSLDETVFSSAVDLLVETRGFVIVTGVGKSGHVGRKIAATLASTGTPSFFVHPTEASHGDLGMMTDGSVVVAISNSGETRELRDVVLHCQRRDIALIAITGKADSFLGRHARVSLVIPKVAEACPNHLAPTSSTTMTMALGDALAVAAMTRSGFTREDFGLRHPGGSLGLQLQRVGEYLALEAPEKPPSVGEGAAFSEVLHAVTDGRVGAVVVVDDGGRLLGIVTDGDIRRALMGEAPLDGLRAGDIMTREPTSLRLEDRMSDAVQIFETRAISQIPVASDGRPAGIVHVKDLTRLGYF